MNPDVVKQMNNAIDKIFPGGGRIAVEYESTRGHVFSELSATYPLKLLSPGNSKPAIVYLMTYGGGLVGGDAISLSIDLGPGSSLVILSQGSTKVFKDRPGYRASGISSANTSSAELKTTQTMDVHISNGATLLLLPDPVTCFKNASYNQLQTFSLDPEASLVLLDTFTSGRKSLSEEWDFSRYYSMNTVYDDETCVAKDIVLLERQQPNEHEPLPPRSLSSRLAPYSCYATAILYGPAVLTTIAKAEKEYGDITVFKQRSVPDILWSFSRIRGGKGGVIRVAGVDTEGVRNWLGRILRTLEDVLGVGFLHLAFPS